MRIDRNDLNFGYAASTYLSDWIAEDREFFRVISSIGQSDVTPDEGRNKLVKIAAYYGVARTLKVISDDHPRLSKAYALLEKKQRPSTLDEAVKLVNGFAEELQHVYGKRVPSAASKFLWMRFQSPIIIYDSIVTGHLSDGKEGLSYLQYCERWMIEFEEYREDVAEACKKVTLFKKSTLAEAVSDKEVTALCSQPWFAERVFDYAIQNISDVRKSRERR